jgi:signal transduction histidine kinase
MTSGSLRTRFVAIVLVGAILPLAIVGAWLGHNSVTTTSRALQAQLRAELMQMRDAIERRWQYRMGDILLLAENEETLRFLRSDQPPDAATIAYLDSIWSPIRNLLPTVEYRGLKGNRLWRFDAPEIAQAEFRQPASLGQSIAVHVQVRDPRNDQRIGEVLAYVRASSLVRDSLPLSLPGARLLVRHRPTGAALIATSELPSDRRQAQRFLAEGQDWIAASVTGDEPSIELIAAAPITPLIAPYRRAARIGALSLAIAALLVSALIFFLTSRMTRGLHQLSVAADALGAGDVHARVRVNGTDEVDRVSMVFNRMACNLEVTLSELAQQRALAVIGEFAAVLSHEVRNALTSVRIDLERARRPQTDDADRIVLAARALHNASRLENIVTGLLRIARSGQSTLTPVNLVDSVRAAVSAVLVQSPRGDVSIDDTAASETVIVGDSAALEQLFTNLILNAVEATEPTTVNTARQSVKVVVRNEDGSVLIDIHDHGGGMTSPQVEQAFQPFYTTKPHGTGLGLAITRTIARSMNGDVRIVDTGPDGTTVRAKFPTTSRFTMVQR